MFIVKINNEIVSKKEFLHFEKYNSRIGDFFSSDRANGDRVCIEFDSTGEPLENQYYANYDNKVFREEYPMAVIEEVVE